MSTFGDRFSGFVDDVGIKLAANCATTANITLSGLQVIDGITVKATDRVLVKDQTDQTQRGLYNPSSGAWTRTVDFASSRNVMPGARVLILQGAVNGPANGPSEWYLSTLTTPIVIGTTPLQFTRIPITSDATLTAIISGLGLMPAPVGTRLLFQQSAAPTGWTKVTTHNNKALRLVNGTASSGGTQPFTTALAAARTPTGTVAPHTLDITEIPAHPHGAAAGTFATYTGGSGNGLGSGSSFKINIIDTATATAGGGAGHAHGLTMDAMAFDVSYVDVILASKD